MKAELLKKLIKCVGAQARILRNVNERHSWYTENGVDLHRAYFSLQVTENEIRAKLKEQAL